VSCVNLVEYRVNLLEKQIDELVQLKSSLLCRTTTSPLKRVPFEGIIGFLETSDLLSVSATCRDLRNSVSCSGRLTIPHLQVTNKICNASQMRLLVTSYILLPVVESITINPGLDSNSHFLYYLAKHGDQLTNLKCFIFGGGKSNSDMTNCLIKFIDSLPRHQIRKLHLSGLKELNVIEFALQRHRKSLEQVRVDVFEKNHARTFSREFPVMPRLTEFVFDVAEDCCMEVGGVVKMLEGIENKNAFTIIYMPHVILSGNAEDVKPMTTLLPLFTELSTLLLRFQNFSVPLKQILELRKNLAYFDSMCISRFFIIGLKYWATWWPQMEVVWPGIDRITPCAIFKEQIDCNSFDVVAERQWLKLSPEDKVFWSKIAVPKVKDLYNRNVSVVKLS